MALPTVVPGQTVTPPPTPGATPADAPMLALRRAVLRHLERFHAEASALTPGVANWLARPFADGTAVARGRMFDDLPAMLANWRALPHERQIATEGGVLPKAITAPLPVLIAALAEDFTPADLGAYNRPVVQPIPVVLPNDPLQRQLLLKTAAAEVRAQVAVVAPDPDTAHALAMELKTFLAANFRFRVPFVLAGVPDLWWVRLDSPQVAAESQPDDEPNVAIYSVNFLLRLAFPTVRGPVAGANGAVPPEADGQGPGTPANPYGFRPVSRIAGNNPRPADGSPAAPLGAFGTDTGEYVAPAPTPPAGGGATVAPPIIETWP